MLLLGFEATKSSPRGHAHDHCASVLLNAVGRSSNLKSEKVCCFSSTEVFSSLTERLFMELNIRGLRCEWWMRKKVDLLCVEYALRKLSCSGEEEGHLLQDNKIKRGFGFCGLVCYFKMK